MFNSKKICSKNGTAGSRTPISASKTIFKKRNNYIYLSEWFVCNRWKYNVNILTHDIINMMLFLNLLNSSKLVNVLSFISFLCFVHFIIIYLFGLNCIKHLSLSYYSSFMQSTRIQWKMFHIQFVETQNQNRHKRT